MASELGKNQCGGTGEGKDGGIWFSLEGSMIVGVLTFDNQEARALLQTMTLTIFQSNIQVIGLARRHCRILLIQLYQLKKAFTPVGNQD